MKKSTQSSILQVEKLDRRRAFLLLKSLITIEPLILDFGLIAWEYQEIRTGSNQYFAISIQIIAMVGMVPKNLITSAVESLTVKFVTIKSKISFFLEQSQKYKIKSKSQEQSAMLVSDLCYRGSGACCRKKVITAVISNTGRDKKLI